MPSPEAEKIIAQMRAEPVGPLRSLEEERTGWELHVKGARPAEGTLVSGVSLSGVPCERVERADSDELVVLYAHGGGFTSGSPRTHRLFAAFLSRATGGRVIVPEYALAPEEPFPAGLDDMVAVYAALTEEGVEPRDIVLAGDSAGGGLALSAALKLRELGAPMPRALVLLSPWADLTLSAESHRTNRAHPNPTEEDLRRSAGWYAPAERHRDPLVSPLFADLSGLPPMLVQVGGHEVLLDDSIELVQLAKRAGVDARLSVAPQLWHGYQLYDCPEARDAIEEIAAFVHAIAPAEAA